VFVGGEALAGGDGGGLGYGGRPSFLEYHVVFRARDAITIPRTARTVTQGCEVRNIVTAFMVSIDLCGKACATRSVYYDALIRQLHHHDALSQTEGASVVAKTAVHAAIRAMRIKIGT
jgi:hypothetical protein